MKWFPNCVAKVVWILLLILCGAANSQDAKGVRNDGNADFITIPPAPKVDPILSSIHQARYASSHDYNPAKILMAVNALQPLGKEKALAALQTYMDSLDPDEPYDDRATNHIFVILRVLFEPFEHGERFPPPANFEWRVYGEELQPDWPLNPIEIVEGIPFKLFGGGMDYSGVPEHPSSHIEFARKHCVIRDAPLIPRISPIVAAEQLNESQKMGRLPQRDRVGSIRSIRKQALLMLPSEWGEIKKGYEENKAVWNEAKERSLLEKIKWVPGQGFGPANRNNAQMPLKHMERLGCFLAKIYVEPWKGKVSKT